MRRGAARRCPRGAARGTRFGRTARPLSDGGFRAAPPGAAGAAGVGPGVAAGGGFVPATKAVSAFPTASSSEAGGSVFSVRRGAASVPSAPMLPPL